MSGIRYICEENSRQISRYRDEVRLDAVVHKNRRSVNSILWGTVVDSDEGRPVPGACIKILDKHFNPKAHTYSDEEGEFFFYDLAVCHLYHILCIAEGYALGRDLKVYLERNTFLKIELKKKKCSCETLIAGRVSGKNNAGIENVRVALFYEKNQIDCMFTDRHGCYFLYTPFSGKHVLKASRQGYITYVQEFDFSAQDRLIEHDFNMMLDPCAFGGTVSGTIYDHEMNPVPYAVVVLYNALNCRPVMFTRANENGHYLFCNVDKGVYFIKANAEFCESNCVSVTVEGEN